jgi:hypothetical protein
MYEDQLEKILNHDIVSRKYFLGAHARDELPERVRYPACIILNNEPRSQPGGHWMAIEWNVHGNGYFFDSYGLAPSYYKLESYMQRTSRSWTHNSRRLQGSSEYCGLYCVLFLLFKLRKQENLFFKNFKKNYDFNDNLLAQLIKKFI